jgi:hypothetical protein
LATSGCGGNGEVERREEHWKTEADSFFRSPRNMGDLHSWLRERQVFYTFEKEEVVDGVWAKVLERIYVDGFVCESQVVLLTVTVSDAGEILTYSVSKGGTCV